MKQLTPVESSNIEALGYYDGASVMTVKFKNGSIYDYAKVPPEVYKSILEAESVGSTFNKTVKAFPQLYPYTKVA
jgi:hypothetical protein